MIPLTVSRAELALARRWVEEAVAEVRRGGEAPRPPRRPGQGGARPEADRRGDHRHDDRDAPGGPAGRRARRGRRLLLLRDQRPDPDDVRLQPRRRRGPDDVGLPRARAARPQPFEVVDARGRRRAGPRSASSGPGRPTRPQDRRLRGARRRPGVDRALLRGRSRLRELLTLPGARWPGWPPRRRCSRGRRRRAAAAPGAAKRPAKKAAARRPPKARCRQAGPKA